MRLRYLCVLCFCLAISCGETASNKPGITLSKKHELLDKMPEIEGEEYRCGEMVIVLNYLRELGKDQCLSALREYLKKGRNDYKVLIICRLLFVNPKGWPPPILGEPVPKINEEAVTSFSLFPIALSENVPFLLVQGYRLGGAAESPYKCLKLCESFTLIPTNYSLTGHERAAKQLTQSESFLKLYQEWDLRVMTEIILRQAKK